MPPPGTGQLFLFGEDVLNTSVDTNTNTILAQIGDVVTNTVDSDSAEFWFPPGFAARPAVPTAGTRAAQVVGFRCSDRDVLVGCRDTRQQGIYGNIKDGETCVYASTGQARTISKADGSTSIITTDDNTPTGNSVFLRVSPTALQFVAPWGTLVFDATGFHVKTQAGARLDLGGIFGLPFPFNSLTSYAKLSAGTVKCDGTQVLLGPDLPTTAYLPAAYGPDPAPAPLLVTGVKSATVRMAP